MAERHDKTEPSTVPPHHETAGAAAARPSSADRERRRRVAQAAEIADTTPTSTPSPSAPKQDNTP